MAGAIMNKVMDFFGVETSQDEEYENQGYDYEGEEVQEEEYEEKKVFGIGRRNNKIVNMPQAQPVKMVIKQPQTFEESEGICMALKERKSIIINLEYVNKDVARRIVDFVSGGVAALDGHMQKISNSIFLAAPTNYDIAYETAHEELKNKISVSWLKNNN